MNSSTSAFYTIKVISIFVAFVILFGCQTGAPEVRSGIADEGSTPIESDKELIWHIKAIHPEGRTIDVKALDKEGNIFDIKAIQDSDQRHLMDIKAIIGSQKVPVKILVSNDAYAPVKAIDVDGTIYDIKALPPGGGKLDVKGVKRSGNIIDIEAISNDGEFLGIKAISPEGQLNDVKGVKMSEESLELTLNGIDVHAHVKALPQYGCSEDDAIWHVKAIHPEGRTIDVKALDKEGNIFDVKAIQDSGQEQLMDIKAFIGGKKLAVKILVSDDEYAPVKAIGEDGTIFDIKALPPEGGKLDVKGVRRVGNIIDIKAINHDGAFYGVKAISPDGQLKDVKGIKMSKENLEITLNGVDVHAHIKTLPQIN